MEIIDITGALGPTPAFLESEIGAENFSQELRIQSNDPDARLRWLVGANYSETEDASAQVIAIGTPDNVVAEVVNSDQLGEADNAAVFASVELTLTERFGVTVGGRYSSDDFEIVAPSGTLFPGSSNEFTPSVTLTFKPDNNSLLYATVSKGYRPGGVDTTFLDDDPNDALTSEYDPETAWNYEIGANATLFDGLLIGRAALFYMNYEDIQEVFFVPPLNLSTITTNGAEAEIFGAEFDVRLLVSENLSFNVNLGLLDSEYTDFDDSPSGDLTGNELPFAPRVNFSATGEYRWPVRGDMNAYVRVEYVYRSDQEGRNNNNPTELQPAYDLLHLRAGATFGNFELELYGENILDEEYFTNRRPGPIVTVVPGRPAIWGIRGTARF
ncbi:MAG: TonB-dependent receptor [Pseudomonadota bacterium]